MAMTIEDLRGYVFSLPEKLEVNWEIECKYIFHCLKAIETHNSEQRRMEWQGQEYLAIRDLNYARAEHAQQVQEMQATIDDLTAQLRALSDSKEESQ